MTSNEQQLIEQYKIKKLYIKEIEKIGKYFLSQSFLYKVEKKTNQHTGKLNIHHYYYDNNTNIGIEMIDIDVNDIILDNENYFLPINIVYKVENNFIYYGVDIDCELKKECPEQVFKKFKKYNYFMKEKFPKEILIIKSDKK